MNFLIFNFKKIQTIQLNVFIKLIIKLDFTNKKKKKHYAWK